MNYKKGIYVMKNGFFFRVVWVIVVNVYVNDFNLFGKNFIDVFSWNGDILVVEY